MPKPTSSSTEEIAAELREYLRECVRFFCRAKGDSPEVLVAASQVLAALEGGGVAHSFRWCREEEENRRQ